MPYKIKILAGILILFFVVGVFYYKNNNETFSEPISSKPTLKINGKIVSLQIADTEIERIAGLSRKSSLPADSGLLFIFDEPDKHGIWMKDMKFSIDILWLDQEYTVIDIAKNVAPDTYPIVFSSQAPALYVLEVNAGTADSYGIERGDKFTPPY